MEHKIKSAFDKVRSGDALKVDTLSFVRDYTAGYAKKRAAAYRRLASAAACLLLLLVGGYWLYFAPTAQISIDINPSIELGVNRFDQVVSVSAYNEDGDALAETLHIRFQDYGAAVDTILQNEGIATLLSNNAVLTITVVGQNTDQTGRILAVMEIQTIQHENTYCYHAHHSDVSSARELGLSCGKYLAFLELKARDSTITPEEIREMTMQEIRDKILMLDGEASDSSCTDDGHHEKKEGNGHGKNECSINLFIEY